MPNIIIKVGRDEPTRKLRLTCGQSSMLVGDPNSVPQSVSREHLIITVDENERIKATNINPNNHTYVNGKNIMEATINSQDKIEMGADRYQTTAKDIIKYFVKEKIDISHLEKIWDDYKNELLGQQKKSQRINLLRTVSSLLTTCAIVSGFIFVDNYWALGITIATIVISLIVTIWTFLQSNAPSKTDERKEQFLEEYSCPKCGISFGNVSFKQLKKKGKCSNCGTQFK